MRSTGCLALCSAFVVSIVAGFMLASGHRARAPQVARAARTAAPTRTAAPLHSAAAAPALLPSVRPAETVKATERETPAPATSLSPLPTGQGRVAIIIDDCGQWPAIERAMIALPIPVTMSIMPQAPYTDAIEHAAADADQGVMLHLPMEPRSGVLAGAGEITTAMDDATIEAQVRADLDDVPLARGVNNHEGSKATADSRVMHAVASVLAERGRFFIDSRTTAATQAAKETLALDVPTLSRNVFLDDVASVAAVEAQLAQTAAVARERGSAIAIGHPKTATLTALRAAIPQMQRAGITFVLASDLLGQAPRAAPGTLAPLTATPSQ